MQIKELMTYPVVTVPPEASLKEVARVLDAHSVSGVPVCSTTGEVIGVVSEADILRKEEGLPPDLGRRRFGWIFRGMDDELAKLAARTAGEAMTTPALTIRPGEQASVAARLMIKHRINRLPVVDRDKLVGIVSRADLVRAFHRADADVEREIREDLLRRTLWITPERLSVSVVDGIVTLKGEVESKADADVVQQYVRAVPGVVDLRLDLTWPTPTREPVSLPRTGRW